MAAALCPARRVEKRRDLAPVEGRVPHVLGLGQLARVDLQPARARRLVRLTVGPELMNTFGLACEAVHEMASCWPARSQASSALPVRVQRSGGNPPTGALRSRGERRARRSGPHRRD